MSESIDIKWQVIDNKGTFFCENNGDIFSNIPNESINLMCIKSNILGKIVYSKENDKLYINDDEHIFSFKILFNDKEHILSKDNLIKGMPNYYKVAHTDYDIITKETNTMVEAYYCGFDNEYLIENKIFKVSFMQSIDLIKNIIGISRIKISSDTKYWLFKIYLNDKNVYTLDVNNYNNELEINLFE